MKIRSNPMEVKCNAVDVTTDGMPVGLQNESLKQLISTTPFSAGKQPVPNSGYIESVKFNTNLTPEEVDKIITEANLDWIDYDGAGSYCLMSGHSWYDVIIVDFKNLVGTTAYGIVIGDNENPDYPTNIYYSPALENIVQEMGGGFIG
jgi:hypothetical protein